LLAQMLMDRGLPAETPALLAEAVSTPQQLLLRSTVGEMMIRLRGGISSSPALILYGPLADP